MKRSRAGNLIQISGVSRQTRVCRARGFTLIELPAVRQRERAAFTLIELLAVIAIIAVLAALLMPAMASAQRKAQAAVCASALKQLGAANTLFASEHQSWCFPLEYYPHRPTHETRWLWFGNPEVWNLCGMGDIVQGGWDTMKWKLRCPSIPAGKWHIGLGMSAHDDNLVWTYSKFDWLGWSLGRVVNPAGSIFYADSTAYKLRWGDYSGEHGTRYVYWKAWGEDTSTWNYHRIAYRHNEGANCLFFDGHVARKPHQELAEDEMQAAGRTADWLKLWEPYKNSTVGLPTAPNYP